MSGAVAAPDGLLGSLGEYIILKIFFAGAMEYEGIFFSRSPFSAVVIKSYPLKITDGSH